MRFIRNFFLKGKFLRRAFVCLIYSTAIARLPVVISVRPLSHHQINLIVLLIYFFRHHKRAIAGMIGKLHLRFLDIDILKAFASILCHKQFTKAAAAI